MPDIPHKVVVEATAERPVKVIGPTDVPKAAQVGDPFTAPTTTAAEEETKKGQRRVNLIWELMQALLALIVINTTLYVSARLALLTVDQTSSEKQLAMAITAFMLVSNLASLIIGFYFGRTNHQKVGGVGSSDTGR